MTETQLRALRILRDHGPVTPTEFAEWMWPDSPYWRVVYRAGPYGSVRGRGLVKSAGSYLAKLRRSDLALRSIEDNYVSISPEGRKALEQAEQARD